MVLAPGLYFSTLLLSSWGCDVDMLQVQVPVAFLLLCMSNVHSRPVSKRNKSHWGAAAECSVWAEQSWAQHQRVAMTTSCSPRPLESWTEVLTAKVLMPSAPHHCRYIEV